MRKLSFILFALCMSISLWAQTSIPSGSNVSCGQSVRITATANEGYEFDKWSDDVTDNPRVVNVNAAVNLTAIFKLKQYTLDPATFGEGVTLNGSSPSRWVRPSRYRLPLLIPAGSLANGPTTTRSTRVPSPTMVQLRRSPSFIPPNSSPSPPVQLLRKVT